METLRLNPKKPGKVTILGEPLPFIIGDSQFREDDRTSEFWKRKLNMVTLDEIKSVVFKSGN